MRKFPRGLKESVFSTNGEEEGFSSTGRYPVGKGKHFCYNGGNGTGNGNIFNVHFNIGYGSGINNGYCYETQGGGAGYGNYPYSLIQFWK